MFVRLTQGFLAPLRLPAGLVGKAQVGLDDTLFVAAGGIQLGNQPGDIGWRKGQFQRAVRRLAPDCGIAQPEPPIVIQCQQYEGFQINVTALFAEHRYIPGPSAASGRLAGYHLFHGYAVGDVEDDLRNVLNGKFVAQMLMQQVAGELLA
ncbi:hypothetical protein D3C76_467420 [compost metagenome]